eukprot:1160963-Pelagomonas_calceolata.AAC.9
MHPDTCSPVEISICAAIALPDVTVTQPKAWYQSPYSLRSPAHPPPKFRCSKRQAKSVFTRLMDTEG